MTLIGDNVRPLLLVDPRCSKCRRATELLIDRGLDFEERRYLEEPLTLAELHLLRNFLARPAHEWTRLAEAPATLALDARAEDERVLAALAAHPHLLQRPILIRGRNAVVGRPPERVLELFTAE